MLDINFFAATDFRGQRKVFGIRREDRRLHMYAIGKTGMGKSSLLVNMALNDAYGGEGFCFIDPHGDAVERMLDYIPPSRVDDVIYFNPADTAYPIPLNPLEEVSPDRRHLLVSGLIAVFRKLYSEHWAHRQEHILRNALYALLEVGESPTLLDIYRLLSDWRYRKQITERVQDPVVKSFWQNEFPKYVFQYKGEALAPIQNKLGAFLTAPLVRNIVGHKECRINFREVIDQGKVLLVNLSKGRIGEDNAAFLGALLVLKLQLATMSRADVPEEERKDFYLYLDEFQTFVANEGLDDLLSEARKFRLGLVLAHQYLGQLDERLREAIFGNVGTLITFPIGPENGETLQKQFWPEFSRQDLVGQDRYHIYLRLAINGMTSKPFSAVTTAPFLGRSPQGNANDIKNRCRTRYAINQSNVRAAAKRQASFEW